MSAMSGGPKGSRLAIMSAFSRISCSWAMARSGWPSLEAVVPAPVYKFHDALVYIRWFVTVKPWRRTMYMALKPSSMAVRADKPS